MSENVYPKTFDFLFIKKPFCKLLEKTDQFKTSGFCCSSYKHSISSTLLERNLKQNLLQLGSLSHSVAWLLAPL